MYVFKYLLALFIFLLPLNSYCETLPAGSANLIKIEKEKRTLKLYKDGKQIKEYKVALGFDPVGHKTRQGDGKTPEGRYKVDWRNPKSSFHRSLHISYPNAQDKANARKAGLDPGGDIMIHGLPNGSGSIGSMHAMRDWTLGCIAVTNEEIEEIWRLVKDGTTVEILP